MNRDLIYLETYVLQQDMRVRMPKTILANMDVEKGKTRFAVFLDKANKEIILRIADTEDKSK